MLHKTRVWKLHSHDGAERFAHESQRDALRSEPLRLLAYLLTEHSWTSCTGWEWNGYAFLNDQTSPDGAGEWGIVRLSDGQQLESVTFGWMTRDEAEAFLRDVARGQLESPEAWADVGRHLSRVALAQIDRGVAPHVCSHCA